VHGQIQRVFSRSLDFPGDLGFSVLVDRCPDGIQHLQFTYPSLDRQTDRHRQRIYIHIHILVYIPTYRKSKREIHPAASHHTP